MVKRLLMPLLAVVMIMVLVVPGCTTPTPPEEPDPVPITLNALIRLDLYVPVYPAGGEYIADQLELAGFDVNRKLNVASDFWATLDRVAALGEWSFATFGWGMGAMPRDTSGFYFWYGTDYIGWPQHIDMVNEPADYRFVSEKLAYKEFFSDAEREALMEDMVWLYMDHSPQVLIADVANVRPYSADFRCATDKASGFGYGWVETVHVLDGSDLPTVPDGSGDMDVLIEQYLLYEDVWNPVAGTSASADLTFLRNMLQERALMHDPDTGLRFPWFIESATVWAQNVLPIVQDSMSEDWLDVNLVPAGGPDLTVPGDAWVRWDATAQKWVTLDEKLAEDAEFPTTAKVRTRVVYDEDIFDTPMHDGSTLSLADFMLSAIFSMDRPQAASAIYDESTASGYATDMIYYRGWEIVDIAPLTIDYYTESWLLDAELNVTTMWPAVGDYAQFVPWHVLAVSMLTEIEGEFVWGPTKAAAADADQQDFVTGGSVTAMKKWLDHAIAEDYIPYYEAMASIYPDFDEVEGTSALLDAEAAARYANLDDWYTEMGHFYVSTSRMYLDKYFATEGQLVLKRFAGHTEPADRWLVEFGMLDVGEAPAHTGAWVDQITVAKNTDPTAGILKVVAGDIDFWFMLGTTNRDLLDAIVEAGLNRVETFGSWTELVINHAPEFEDGRPNPLHYSEIRRELHFLIDKEFFVEEFMGGLGVPTYALYGSAFAEYLRYPGLFDEIEEAYRYTEDRKAAAIARIADFMEGKGFELIDGKWHYYPEGAEE